MKHTPGPWNVTGWENVTVNAANGSTIVTTPGGGNATGDGITLVEIQANARLIATAPEMLEALKVLSANRELGEYESQKQGLPRMIEANDLARQAIAKAEGKKS